MYAERAIDERLPQRVLVTPPATEPIDLLESGMHARIDSDDEADLILALIRTAREAAEHQTGRVFVSQTWDVRFPFFSGNLPLGLSPVRSITSITYIDPDGNEQTLDPAEYRLDPMDPAIVTHGPASRYAWPAVSGDELYPVRVRVVAGYGNAAAVPECVKTWMKMAVTWLNDHRDETLPRDFAAGLLDPVRLYL